MKKNKEKRKIRQSGEHTRDLVIANRMSGYFALGAAYLAGVFEAVEKDLAKAAEWLRKAAKNGNPAAQKQLNEMGLA